MSREKKSNAVKVLCIALALILVSSVFACVLQSDFGNISIKEIYIVADEQQVIHAQAFIPKNASRENKVPCVVAQHGWLNTLEMQDATCIELARRGIMVIAPDAYSHGLSSNVNFAKYGGIFSPLFWCEGEEDYDALGTMQVVKYITSDVIDFVDTSRIGLAGHSMGAVDSLDTLKNFGALYNQAIEEAKAPDSEGGEEITESEQAYADSFDKISACLLMGYSPGRINDLGYWDHIYANIGLIYGKYEEGGVSNSTGSGIILGDSYEATSFVNNAAPGVDEEIAYVEEGVYYGDFDKGTVRVLWQPAVDHPLEHFSPKCISYEIEFFEKAFDVDSGMASTSQIWLIKEIMNCIALIGLLMTLVPLTKIFLDAPCFASLKASAEPPMIPALDAKRKRNFWIGWVLGGAFSFIGAVIAVKAGGKLFADWMNTQRPVWASYTFNILAMWTSVAAIWSMIWFWLNYKKDKADGVRTPEMIGWKISGRNLLKTCGLVLLVIAVYYAIVWFIKWAFNTDFRLWTPAVKTFSPKYIIYFLVYFPTFFVFYLANSLINNGAMRVEGMSERKNLFLCALGNILGVLLMFVLQYGKLVITGTVLWKDWIMAYVIIWCFWQLFLAPYLERKFFKLTGNNWFGAMLIALIYVMMGIANTSLVGIA